MKKLLTIGILMGIIAVNGEKTMASGSAYTTYKIEEMQNERTIKAPRENIDLIKKITPRNYR